MKNIKNFKLFIEKLSQEDLDKILDKIGSKGFDSLSDSEKKALDNHSKGIENEEESIESIISEINNILDNKYDGAVSIGQLMADSSPLYKEDSQGIHLIEFFMEDLATVEIYGGYKYETHIDSYDIQYNELDIDTLIEIRDLIKQ